jgi:hypothetical protein
VPKLLENYDSLILKFASKTILLPYNILQVYHQLQMDECECIG